MAVAKHTSLQGVESYEYQLPEDGEDEEIDEDEAFNSEDEKLYAGWFDNNKAAAEDEGEQGEEGSYNTDDFSEEEVGMHC